MTSEIEMHRKEITDFLSMINKLSSDILNTAELKALLWSLIAAMDTFNIIPESFVTSSSKKLDSAEYQHIHGHLDWKWLILSIFFKITPTINKLEREKLIKFHILDLISISRQKFDQTSITELISTKAFPCICFTEYYILIQNLAQNNNLLLWPCFNDCLKLFEETKNIFKSINLSDMDRNTHVSQCKHYFHFVL